MPVEDHDLAQIVIETVGALVVVLDREGRIQRWNASPMMVSEVGRITSGSSSLASGSTSSLPSMAFSR